MSPWEALIFAIVCGAVALMFICLLGWIINYAVEQSAERDRREYDRIMGYYR